MIGSGRLLILLSVWFWDFFQFLPIDTVPPQLLAPAIFERNPNPAVPLAGILRFDTNEPAVLILEINGRPGIFPERRLQQRHVVPVVGLIPNMTNTVRLSLTDVHGNISENAAQFDFDAPSLPPDFPSIRTAVSHPSLIEPGVTLFNAQSNQPGFGGLIVAVDAQGNVVWYYRTSRPIGPVIRIRNGNLLYLDDVDAVEIDILGNTVARWHPTGLGRPAVAASDIAVSTNVFHHEIVELPNGNLVTLSNEVRRIADYPSSEVDPDAPAAEAAVVGDVLVEFARDGAVIHEWKLFDILDPYRIRYDSLSGFFNAFYAETYGPTRDWTHANSVHYDAHDDSFVVSLRHQDAVIKIARTTGHLLWIFGGPDWRVPWSVGLFQAQGVLNWPFHQHTARLTPQRTLLMFDNGNYQAKPFEPKRPPSESYSRVVEYQIDEATGIATEKWVYGGPGQEHFYSPALGNAEWLPRTGNVLFTDGAKNTDEFGLPSDTPNRRWARIVEVTTTIPSEKVFELQIGSPSLPSTTTWTVYRGTRLSGLYP